MHGGALARSPWRRPYEERQTQSVDGKTAVARAAATLLEPGQTVIVDGGSTALHFVEAIPPDHTGHLHHAQPAGRRRARAPRRDARSSMIGGTLDARAMVVRRRRRRSRPTRASPPTSASSASGALHATAGMSGGYHEEAELRRVLVQRADRVVGLASRDKLGTTAPFGVAPATALTHLATEPDVPAELLAPFEELGLHVVR